MIRQSCLDGPFYANGDDSPSPWGHIAFTLYVRMYVCMYVRGKFIFFGLLLFIYAIYY